MDLSKAQLVVWAAIAGLSIAGTSALTRVTRPAPVMAPAEAAVTVGPAPTAKVDTLPPTVAAFPFPDDLETATVGEQPAAVMQQPMPVLAELQAIAAPDIATVASVEDATLTVALSEPVADTAATGSEEPPAPMPERPLAASRAEAISPAEMKTLYVVADTLNVRAAPSIDGPVVQRVSTGFAIAPQLRTGDWVGFLMQDGSTGWIKTDYLSDTRPEATAETTSTEPLDLMM